MRIFVFEIEAAGFERPLCNTLQTATESPQLITVQHVQGI
jgi:hypothetical protein